MLFQKARNLKPSDLHRFCGAREQMALGDQISSYGLLSNIGVVKHLVVWCRPDGEHKSPVVCGPMMTWEARMFVSWERRVSSGRLCDGQLPRPGIPSECVMVHVWCGDLVTQCTATRTRKLYWTGGMNKTEFALITAEYHSSLTPCIHYKLYTVHYKLYTLHYTLYTIHCTLCTIHCKLYTIHYTLYSIHCTLYTIYYTLYTIQYTLYTKHYTVYTVHCTLCTIQYTLYTLQYTLYAKHYTVHTVHSTVYTVHSTLNTIQYTLYTLQYTLYTKHYAVYTVHYTVYTVHCTLYSIHCTIYSIHLHSTVYTLH
jgi:hypothetical protein